MANQVTTTVMGAINFYYADMQRIAPATTSPAPDTSGLHPDAANWPIMFTATADGDAMGTVAGSYGQAATDGLYQWAAYAADEMHRGTPKGSSIQAADVLYALRLGLHLWCDWQ